MDTLVSFNGVSAKNLKIIAVIAMLLDHIAFALFDSSSILYLVLRLLGRVTMPIMCFFIAEGYYKTKDLKKYLLRLSILAIISHFIFYYFATGIKQISFDGGLVLQISLATSVIVIFILGILALHIYNSKNLNIMTRVVLIGLICVVSNIADWGFIGILMILAFGCNDGLDNKLKAFTLVAMLMVVKSIFSAIDGMYIQAFSQLGLFMAVPLIRAYNGQFYSEKRFKYFFYIFYPLHLLILGYIKHSI